MTTMQSLYATGELYFEKVVGLEGLESIQAILCCAMYSMRSSSGVSIWSDVLPSILRTYPLTID